MPYILYPLSAGSGLPIPLDVVEPLGYDILTVTGAPMAAPISIPADCLVSAYCPQVCIIGFSPTPVDGSTTKGDTILLPNTRTTLFPLSQELSAILPTTGTYAQLLLAYYKKFDTLANQEQVTYG